MMVRFEAARHEEIQRRHLLHDGLQEQPFQKDWITEVLLQLIVRQPSFNPLLASHTTASFIATASAKPMSWPFEFHPGARDQAAH